MLREKNILNKEENKGFVTVATAVTIMLLTLMLIAMGYKLYKNQVSVLDRYLIGSENPAIVDNLYKNRFHAIFYNNLFYNQDQIDFKYSENEKLKNLSKNYKLNSKQILTKTNTLPDTSRRRSGYYSGPFELVSYGVKDQYIVNLSDNALQNIANIVDKRNLKARDDLCSVELIFEPKNYINYRGEDKPTTINEHINLTVADVLNKKDIIIPKSRLKDDEKYSYIDYEVSLKVLRNLNGVRPNHFQFTMDYDYIDERLIDIVEVDEDKEESELANISIYLKNNLETASPKNNQFLEENTIGLVENDFKLKLKKGQKQVQ